ncbi:MAG: DNA repair protein RadA [Syntrophomonadaceae bacterium]|nr:DNA repair protein RadA [Syntrophomonadaceae bacterium]MDD3022711.1 DNA repair protein RadA [Syntrophomonadaceae bacterium]
MGKITSKFVCSECGYETAKWLGKCPGCSAWSTLVEESRERKKRAPGSRTIAAVPLNSIADNEISRFSTGMGEWDRVLGGGIVPGSLILLGGDPGIGKSTLLLQAADFLARKGKRVLYLSGEESLKQIRLRSIRLGIASDEILLLNEQDIDLLPGYVEELDPDLLIIDSIQSVFSKNISSIPGSVSQLRECTARIMDIAKKMEKAVVLVGHVTKDGALAGPKVLEHMVDVVVYFEGEKNFSFRILRGVKNRFGSTDEIGLLEMSGQGLVEVLDPSYIFLSRNQEDTTGSAIVASFEGSRTLLIEIQALVSPAGSGYAKRMASGIDQNRLALIIAVLEKRRGYNLSLHDVYLKVTGGMFLKDPSVDLGIAAAIISSYLECPLPINTVFSGELSLSGQIRAIPFLDLRLKEVEKMGYKRVVIPARAEKTGAYQSNLELIEINNIDDLIAAVMEG